MALGANCKRALENALAQHGMGAELHAAVDANTLKTSMPIISTLTTTTANATTTWLHSAIKTLVANMQAASHMS